MPRIARSPALKHLLGSVRAMAGRLALLVAITAASFGIFAGGLSAIDSTLAARDAQSEAGQLADLELRLATTDAHDLPDFAQLPEVGQWRARAAVMGTIAVADDPTLSIQLIAGQADDAVDLNRLTLISGELLDADDDTGILVDWHLADSHGVSVGQIVDITVGQAPLSLMVRGVVRDAQYLMAPANPMLFVPAKGSLGIGFVNIGVLTRLDGFTPVNSVLFRASPGTDGASLRAAVLAAARQAGLTQAYAQAPAEQFAPLFLGKNLATFAVIVPVIVGVTGLSAVFVTFFLLAQWLRRERRHLAVHLTLGYTPAALARSFVVVLAALAAASITLGLAVAVVLARLFIGQFADSVGIPIAPTRLTASYLWSGGAAIAVLFLAAGAFAVHRVSAMVPLDAMRQVSAEQARPGRLAGYLGRALPTSWLRLSLRNTVRDKAVSLLTIVSMALGFGATASFSLTFSSVFTSATAAVDASEWDLLVDFAQPLTAPRIGQLASGVDGVTDWTPFVGGVVQVVSAAGEPVNLILSGFDPAKPWHAVPGLSAGHNIVATEPGGILIEESAARQIGLVVGDSLTLDSTVGRFEARLIGIFSGALPGEARLTEGFAREVLGLGQSFTGVLVQVASGGLPRAQAEWTDLAEVQQTLTQAQIKDQVTDLSSQVSRILRLGQGVSTVVALLFVLACLGYTVLKRQGDYQLLRILGFGDGVVRATILTETWLLGLAAAGLAVPFGAAAAAFTGWRISTVWFHIDTTLTVVDYAGTLVPALALLPVVALPMAQTVLNQPLDAYLRSRDVG